MSETTTPEGYTGAEALVDLAHTGQEPAELSEAKDTVHTVLDSWQQHRGLEFTGDEDGIELAEEIVNKLLADGAVLPGNNIDGEPGPFEYLAKSSTRSINSDFDLLRTPGCVRPG